MTEKCPGSGGAASSCLSCFCSPLYSFENSKRSVVSSLLWCFSTGGGRFCYSGHIWQCLETFWVATEGLVMASSGQRPAVLLNIPWGTEQSLPRGSVGGGGKEWEFGTSRGKLLHTGWINNKVLLCSTRNYIQDRKSVV